MHCKECQNPCCWVENGDRNIDHTENKAQIKLILVTRFFVRNLFIRTFRLRLTQYLGTSPG